MDPQHCSARVFSSLPHKSKRFSTMPDLCRLWTYLSSMQPLLLQDVCLLEQSVLSLDVSGLRQPVLPLDVSLYNNLCCPWTSLFTAKCAVPGQVCVPFQQQAVLSQEVYSLQQLLNRNCCNSY
jgi:hypothetical protein